MVMSDDEMLSVLDRLQRRFSKAMRAGQQPASVGLSQTPADINRLFARLQLAVRYESSTFAGYSEATASAYSSMVALLLAWSAFERTVAATGLTNGQKLNYAAIDKLFTAYEVLDQRADWNAIRPILPVLAEHCTAPKLREALENAANGEALPVRSLVSALRNTFAHGMLTAHFGGTKPLRLAKACRALSAVLLSVQVRRLHEIMVEAEA